MGRLPLPLLPVECSWRSPPSAWRRLGGRLWEAQPQPSSFVIPPTRSNRSGERPFPLPAQSGLASGGPHPVREVLPEAAPHARPRRRSAFWPLPAAPCRISLHNARWHACAPDAHREGAPEGAQRLAASGAWAPHRSWPHRWLWGQARGPDSPARSTNSSARSSSADASKLILFYSSLIISYPNLLLLLHHP